MREDTPTKWEESANSSIYSPYYKLNVISPIALSLAVTALSTCTVLHAGQVVPRLIRHALESKWCRHAMWRHGWPGTWKVEGRGLSGTGIRVKGEKQGTVVGRS